MSQITTVYFNEDVTLDGTTVKKGTYTQVRYDLGCGDIWIDGTGKIAETAHQYPLRGDEAAAYAKELMTYTGGIETNMGTLFFKKGQLCNLDFTAEEVSRRLSGLVEPKTSNTVNGLDRTLTYNEGMELFEAIDFIRVLITKDLPEGSDESWYSLKLEYTNRPAILVDPFH